MSARLGLPAALMACVLLIATPAFADEGPTTSTSVSPSTTSPTSTAPTPSTAPAPTTTTSTNPTTIAAATTSTTPDTTPVASAPASSPTTVPVPATDGTTAETSIDAASTATSLAPALTAGAAVLTAPDPLGPARAAGSTPARGDQIQIIEPPADPTLEAFIPPTDSGSGRRVVYSKSKQTVWVYDESNTIIKSHRVSGKQTPYDPAPGVYSVFSRSIRTYAINNPSITWGYMVRFAHGARGGNIGFHEIPYQYGGPVQTEAQLGEALSGGCVRQTTEDAIWMWNWAHVGTVVVVTP